MALQGIVDKFRVNSATSPFLVPNRLRILKTHHMDDMKVTKES